MTTEDAARPASFSDQVYGRIMTDIISGLFPTGARLPSEQKLGERFAVSRPVIRDALARLQRDGLVESRKGSGTYVMSRPPADLALVADVNEVARFQRFQEYRLIVEAAAAALAAERRDESSMARIQEAHERFVTEIRSGIFEWRSDRALHMAIAEASGNEFFAEALNGSEMQLGNFMQVSLRLSQSRSPQRGEIVIREHANIVEAIRARDRNGARIAIEYHLVQSRRRMLDRSLAP